MLQSESCDAKASVVFAEVEWREQYTGSTIIRKILHLQVLPLVGKGDTLISAKLQPVPILKLNR